MAITSNCAEIIITNPQGSVSFNKLITTTELSPAKTIYSEDRVYLIQNSENVPQTFWWNLEKAIADGYADLEELYDYFVAEIANQCGGGGGGGIESIVEGTNITVDDTDPQNPIISATGGGGSPAGSDNQIQINQSGSFFADSTFQKSDTDFNVGLDRTTQSAVTFTGSGLDNLTLFVNVFSGTYPTTYTVAIDGVNKDVLQIQTSTITGGSFAVADTITNGLGGSATIDAISTLPSDDKTVLIISSVSGSFSAGNTIDNGLGVTGTSATGVQTYDTITWTDGTTTVNNTIAVDSNGVVAGFSARTGHTLSDSWTWTYSTVNQNVLDFSNNDYKFSATIGTDTFGYQIGDNLLGFGLKGSVNTWVSGSDLGIQGLYEANGFTILANSLVISGIEYGNVTKENGEVVIGNLSGGNNTKITIDDVNEHITISNLPAYDDDTAAGVGGLTAGMVYMTTGSGSAPLNAAGILMIKQ